MQNRNYTGNMFRKYDKPGPGVDENAPQRRSFFHFLELFFRKFGKLIQLNLLYLVTIIPSFAILFFLGLFVLNPILSMFSAFIGVYGAEAVNAATFLLTILFPLTIICVFGAGPVTAGFVYVLRNYSREEHAWLLSDFFEHTKKNFKQALCVFLIDIVVIFAVFFAINFYRVQFPQFAFLLSVLLLVFFVIYTLMHLYIYPMMVTFKLPLRALYRNALIFALAKLPKNIIITAFILGFIYIAALFAPISMLIMVPLILFSLCGFTSVFWTYPTLKKHMLIEPNDEVKPE